MSNGPLAKVSAKTASEICRRFQLGNDAQKLLREGLAPRQFLDLLVDHQHFADAVRFLAHALPKREAIWWACLCVRQVFGSNPSPQAAAALHAVETWVVSPSDDTRRATMPAAEAAEFGTPAGSAAVAVFFSGGSLAPPDLPAVPPGEGLTAGAVAGAILLAAVLSEPENAVEKFRAFLALGIEVADGNNRWKEAAAKPAASPKRW